MLGVPLLYVYVSVYGRICHNNKALHYVFYSGLIWLVGVRYVCSIGALLGFSGSWATVKGRSQSNRLSVFSAWPARNRLKGFTSPNPEPHVLIPAASSDLPSRCSDRSGHFQRGSECL